MAFFEREAKIMFGVPITFVLLFVVFVEIYFWAYNPIEAARADDCLTRGGRFDTQEHRCDFKLPSPDSG